MVAAKAERLLADLGPADLIALLDAQGVAGETDQAAEGTVLRILRADKNVPICIPLDLPVSEKISGVHAIVSGRKARAATSATALKLTLTTASGGGQSVDFPLEAQLSEGVVHMARGSPSALVIAIEGSLGSYILSRVQILGKPATVRKTAAKAPARKRKTVQRAA